MYHSTDKILSTVTHPYMPVLESLSVFLQGGYSG